ncbi:MAG: MEDS domain-containing protein [Actinomycetota bacterium]|nr:MEDS domain-containing protein [Actinomycetota bacterium]
MGSGEDVDHTAHFVEYYEDVESLTDSVRTFISIGISRGDAAIVIAERGHLDAFEAELGRVVDLERARRGRSYLSLEAGETLARFMVGGLPDAGRFEAVVGELIARASSGGRRVRVFGEMVALLWARGNVAGALALEDLWNGLADRYRFRLFCAYPTTAFDGDLASSDEVSRRHSHIVVTKSQVTR